MNQEWFMPDWFDKGFNDYFNGAPQPSDENMKPAEETSRGMGWYAGRDYRDAIKARIASPRDTEISDLKEIIRWRAGP